VSRLPEVLRIATRRSPLALWQTEHVASMLRIAHPELDVKLLPMSTRGDEVLDRSLASIGGKGLFLKELEEAMLRGEADIAVHSLKDVPMELEPGFAIGAVLQRADPFDAWVSSDSAGPADLPPGAVVGTSSLRRQAQLRSIRPDLELRDLRGNVNTRLARLDAGQYQAIVLASAGLQRLGLESRIRSRLLPPQWLPAVAQGAIAVECRSGDAAVLATLHDLEHSATRLCVDAERAMNRHLHGSCEVPVAGYCELVDGRLHLRGRVGDAATGQSVDAEATAAADEGEILGRQVAQLLLERGAGPLLGR
jgi:hydroxymethylbilane synthase